MRVVRIYHGGRTSAHRARERAMVRAGLEIVLVVPREWSEGGAQGHIPREEFEVVELAVERPDDVNRHRYADPNRLARVIADAAPDLVDLHEEPFSAVCHQVLGVIPAGLPVVAYTAQNLDKRYPPPFTGWERGAFGRLSGIYSCSRQAASVARGRGFAGLIDVLALGYDPAVFGVGQQRHDDACWRLVLLGRMVAEKGVRDAVRALAAVRARRPAELVLLGSGPELAGATALARDLGVADDLVTLPWAAEDQVAELLRSAHAVVVPSRATARWVEQFGRTVVEGQACGAAVVAYASGAIPEVAARAACLVAEGDSAGLARAVTRLASSAEYWQRLRSAGLATSADKAWPVVADRHVEFYERSIAAGPVPAAVAGPGTRRAAREEFGAGAWTGDRIARPVALPLIRDVPAVNRLAGRAIDGGAAFARNMRRQKAR